MVGTYHVFTIHGWLGSIVLIVQCVNFPYVKNIFVWKSMGNLEIENTIDIEIYCSIRYH